MGVVYNDIKLNGYDGAGIDLINDDIKVALLADTYTPDIDSDDNFDDVSGDEVSGSGYSAGGQSLANKSYSVDTTNDRAVLTADDITWAGATLTARYAVLYKDTGTPGTSKLIGYIDFGSNQSVSGSNFVIQWGSVGVLTVS